MNQADFTDRVREHLAAKSSEFVELAKTQRRMAIDICKQPAGADKDRMRLTRQTVCTQIDRTQREILGLTSIIEAESKKERQAEATQ